MAESFWRRDIHELIPFLRIKPNVPLHDLAVFCRKLAFLLDAGVPLKTAVSVISEQSPAKAFKGKLSEVHAYIMRGDGLSNALKATGLFPAFLYGLVAVGELTARLPKVAGQLADYYERQAKIRDELKAAMVYPAAATCLMLLVMAVAVTYVLPNYGRVFAASDVPLPAATQALLNASGFIAAHPYGVPALMVLIIAGIAVFLKSNTADRLRLFVPLYRQVTNLRFTQAMSLMLSSGQPLAAAVLACAQVFENKSVKRDMVLAASGLNEGRAFWEALAQVAYIDPLLTDMIRVGEETGRLPQTMEKCQWYFTQAYVQSLKRASKLIEPVITVVLGLLLGFLMLAIILPTFALMDVV
jgi:type IV pilus assembly protein PilC